MFKDTLLQEEQSIIERKKHKITLETFLLDVSNYSTLDDAFEELPEEYAEFYINNSTKLNKALKNMHMLESAESPGETGWSPSVDTMKYKTIKYKGSLITLEWNPELRTWLPTIRMRSIVGALKYAKSLVDNIDNQ